MKKTFILFLFLLLFCSTNAMQKTVEKWKVYEITLKASGFENPFDVEFNATFTHKGGSSIKMPGFYDGNGSFKVRFMPKETGTYSYITQSKLKGLDGRKGSFVVLPASKNNHGMVQVSDTYHFAYSDGTRYYPFGTTCYAWAFQSDQMKTLTLQSLSSGHFNKMRMCLFPKWFEYNHEDPSYFPFEGAKGNFDWDRFVPAYFQNLDRCIQSLDSMGIEADLIVFHPYDTWGFKSMSRKTDDRYIRYIIARYAAYKNVWWSMANEYDLMKKKVADDWQHYLEMFAINDPYNHLRSNHQYLKMFDHTNPLITHACIQGKATEESGKMRDTYNKPVIYDECEYEGDLQHRWGCLTPQTELDRFWKAVCTGGYAGHSETYISAFSDKDTSFSKGKIWWSHGGVLKGESAARIKFLRSIVESAPGPLKPTDGISRNAYVSSYNNDYFLLYFDWDYQHSLVYLNLPVGKKFHIEYIDTWNMTITQAKSLYEGNCKVSLQGKQGYALRISVAR